MPTGAFVVPHADSGFERSAHPSLEPASADLALIELQQGVRLLPASLFGLLWLQTHFESRHWPALAAGEVRLDADSSEQLAADAEAAGLRVARIAISGSSAAAGQAKAAVATERQPGPG